MNSKISFGLFTIIVLLFILSGCTTMGGVKKGFNIYEGIWQDLNKPINEFELNGSLKRFAYGRNSKIYYFGTFSEEKQLLNPFTKEKDLFDGEGGVFIFQFRPKKNILNYKAKDLYNYITDQLAIQGIIPIWHGTVPNVGSKPVNQNEIGYYCFGDKSIIYTDTKGSNMYFVTYEKGHDYPDIFELHMIINDSSLSIVENIRLQNNQNNNYESKQIFLDKEIRPLINENREMYSKYLTQKGDYEKEINRLTNDKSKSNPYNWSALTNSITESLKEYNNSTNNSGNRSSANTHEGSGTEKAGLNLSKEFEPAGNWSSWTHLNDSTQSGFILHGRKKSHGKGHYSIEFYIEQRGFMKVYETSKNKYLCKDYNLEIQIGNSGNIIKAKSFANNTKNIYTVEVYNTNLDSKKIVYPAKLLNVTEVNSYYIDPSSHSQNGSVAPN